MFAPGLGLAKRTRTIAVLNVAAAVLNTALNFLLIPRLGLMGAAVATLIGSIFTAVAYVILGSRHYRVPHAWPGLLGAAGVGALVLLVAAFTWGRAPAADLAAWFKKLTFWLAASMWVAALLVRQSEVSRMVDILARRGPVA
jgi:O-antigen/teichoic acid export membrane protein